MKQILIAALLVLSPVVASAAIVPQQGGAQPWCSSPTAPGWHVDLRSGGCGASGLFGAVAPTFFASGSSVTKNGVVYFCSVFMGLAGCVI